MEHSFFFFFFAMEHSFCLSLPLLPRPGVVGGVGHRRQQLEVVSICPGFLLKLSPWMTPFSSWAGFAGSWDPSTLLPCAPLWSLPNSFGSRPSIKVFSRLLSQIAVDLQASQSGLFQRLLLPWWLRKSLTPQSSSVCGHFLNKVGMRS